MIKIGVIACGKQKLARVTRADELYTGRYFKACQAYILASGVVDYRILSAKYGLVKPNALLAPYELLVTDLNPADKLAWVSAAQKALRELRCDTIVSLLGKKYRPALDGIETPIEEPLCVAGLSTLRMAYHMEFLNREAARLTKK